MSIGETIRNPIWVRFADQAKEPVKEWLDANKSRNGFDPAVLGYESTKVLAAHNNGTVYVYMPLQQIAMLESLGINKDAKPLEIANALRELVQASVTLASGAGMGEVWFAASDPNTETAAQWLGFEKVPFTMYRKKI